MNGAVFLLLHEVHGLGKKGRGVGVSGHLCLVVRMACVCIEVG